MYKEGKGKTHRNLAHIMVNYYRNEGWITECDAKPLYLEWYCQSMKEDTLRRRFDEMVSGGYAKRGRRQFRYKTHSTIVRAYKLTKKGERLLKVKMVA